MRDSCRSSGTGETPQVLLSTEEAHRPPCGKRAPGAEINMVAKLRKNSNKLIQMDEKTLNIIHNRSSIEWRNR